MKIIFDCFKQIKGFGKSIGIYNVALNLVRNLVNIRKDSQIEYIVLGNKYNRDDFKIDGVKFIEIQKNPMNKFYCILWELFDVAKIYKKLGGDVIIFPRGYTTFLKQTNDIVIIHDLIPFYYNEHYPGVFNRIENAYIMLRLRRSMQQAKRVVTISQASKIDILKIAKISENKISVINNGLNKIDVNTKEHRGYIVAMTSDLPHKNAVGVVKSYEQYCKKARSPMPIKIIGIKDIGKYNLITEIANKITCYKFIKSNDEMYEIIGRADIFLFLSEIEGFGFPPIEAMQLGVPVICSNCSSMPEIVGDAAILVNPHDYEKVAQAIFELQYDKDKQLKLVKKGYENIRRYDWDKIAKQYQSLLYLEVNDSEK